MTNNDFLTLKPGDKVKFTGVHGGIPLTLVPAGQTGTVDSVKYIQLINKFEAKIIVAPLSWIYVHEPDSIDFDYGPTIVITPLNVNFSINGVPVKSQKKIAFDLEDTLNGPTIKCECGATAVGIKLHTPGHSSWCPGRSIY